MSRPFTPLRPTYVRPMEPGLPTLEMAAGPSRRRSPAHPYLTRCQTRANSYLRGWRHTWPVPGGSSPNFGKYAALVILITCSVLPMMPPISRLVRPSQTRLRKRLKLRCSVGRRFACCCSRVRAGSILVDHAGLLLRT